MKRINFRQPKYIFPLVIFVPAVCVIYFVMQMFDSDGNSEMVATDQINATLPDPNLRESGDKLSEMQKRFGTEDAYTAMGVIGEDEVEQESIEHGYSEDELDRIDAAEAERIRRQRELEEMKQSLAESRKHINSYAGASNDYTSDLEEIQRRSIERQNQLYDRFDRPDMEAIERKRMQDSIAHAKEIEREKNRPYLVLKSQETNAGLFNTVVNDASNVDAPLIRAMIDKTTKAHEGTRIRFKLLDEVTIKGMKIAKGSYLYGTVTGFGQQRVRASITSILIGNKFVNINLSVFDNDGMEGFYVPESAFRDFMKEAGASAVQQNMNFTSDVSYGGISGEAVALQALQNIYNSATTALSANIRKNRAKIKYNTIVYLVNSDDAR